MFYQPVSEKFFNTGCIMLSLPHPFDQCFPFSPRKSKVPVKRVFYHFSGFFHGCKALFTATFFEISTPSRDFSRGLFGIFHGFDLRCHGRKTKIFHGRDIFFTGRLSEKKSKTLKIIISIHKIQKIFAKKRYFLKKTGFFHGHF